MIYASNSVKALSKCVLIFSVCMILLLTLISIAPGKPFRLEKLPNRGKNFSCGTCHVTPGGPLNSFGQDYNDIAIPADDTYTGELGKMDSDGDGFSNDKEFAANTHPGKSDSKPEGAAVIQSEQPAPSNAKTYLYRIGKISALIGFMLILMPIISSSNIKLIERQIGLDMLFWAHKKVGVLALIMVIIHPTMLFLYNSLDGYRLAYKVIGSIAFYALLLGAGAALLYAKLKLKYETWKNIHKINYAIFPIAFIHSILLGSDLYGWSVFKIIWIILAFIYIILIACKIWNYYYVKSHPFNITNVVEETHDVTSLHFEGRHIDYKPGQFMIIRLIRNGEVSEPHPFTISSSPTQDRLSISVKSVGDFTATIGDTKVSDSAYIDAPYGRFSFLNNDSQQLVFIAGGIGITPFMSMLRYIHDSRPEKNVILIWGNKTEADIAFRNELENISAGMPSLKIVHIMSGQDDWPGEKGYVDAEKLKKHIENLQESQFFICGPPIMMTAVVKSLKALGITKKHIHYERFALR